MSFLLNGDSSQSVEAVFSGVYKTFSESLPLDSAHWYNALVIAIIGILVVFVILGIIAGFVKLLGTVFDKITSKKSAPAKAADIPAAPAGDDTPKAAPVKAEVKLIDVTEEEAAMIMAIVSDKTNIPLSHLKFNTIKPVEENK